MIIHAVDHLVTCGLHEALEVITAVSLYGLHQVLVVVICSLQPRPPVDLVLILIQLTHVVLLDGLLIIDLLVDAFNVAVIFAGRRTCYLRRRLTDRFRIVNLGREMSELFRDVVVIGTAIILVQLLEPLVATIRGRVGPIV